MARATAWYESTLASAEAYAQAEADAAANARDEAERQQANVTDGVSWPYLG